MQILGFLFLVICFLITTCYSGFVFSNIWEYFAVPLGMKALSVPHAMGVITLVGYPLAGLYLKLESIKESELTFATYGASLFRFVIFASLLWGWAALVHSFM